MQTKAIKGGKDATKEIDTYHVKYSFRQQNSSADLSRKETCCKTVRQFTVSLKSCRNIGGLTAAKINYNQGALGQFITSHVVHLMPQHLWSQCAPQTLKFPLFCHEQKISE